MMPLAAPTAGAPQNSNRFARERDARILWLLDMHPATAAMLVRIGLFPNKNKALKRLQRLTARKRIKLVGTVARTGGRPEHVYCRFLPKADQLLHEVELTELCLRIHAARILRGPHVTDTEIRPDAELWINEQLYFLELDRGSMSYAQIRRRFQKYEQTNNFVLWVCPTEVRLDGMRHCAERIQHIALFTTIALALVNPHAEIWLDYQGDKAALPRHKEERKASDEPRTA